MPKTEGVRLNKYLAAAGLGSRRAVEELILRGVVRVNGEVVDNLATRVGPEDSVTVRRRPIKEEEPLSAILNKPRGYICSRAPDNEARTIFELLPKNWPRVFYVGRLDKESQGLVLLTNNGDLAQRLTHPSEKMPKIYEVTLDKSVDERDSQRMLKGMTIEGRRARVDAIEKIGPTRVRVTLTQGIKRQIRLMFLYRGYKVRRLVRTRIGTLSLGTLTSGRWRILSDRDLKKHFGTPASKPSASDRPDKPRRRSPRHPKR